MSEHSLWVSLRGLLPAGCHASRIESHDTASGFPDVHYTYQEVSGTLELKEGKAPFKKKGLRKDQINWMADECEAGGIVWIVAQVGKTVYVVFGTYADRFNDLDEDGLDTYCAAKWKVGAYEPGILEGILRNT